MRGVWLVLLAVVTSQYWTDKQSGSAYDWSALQRDEPWVVLSKLNDEYYTTVYSFSFGQDLKLSCNPCGVHRTPVPAVAQIDILGNLMEDCVVLGRRENTQVELLDPNQPEAGIVVTYHNGDPCSDVYSISTSNPRAVTFRLRCRSDHEEGQFRIIKVDGLEEYETCDTVFETYTVAGCPVPQGSRVLKVAKWMVFVTGVCIIGFYAIICLRNRLYPSENPLSVKETLSSVWTQCQVNACQVLSPLRLRSEKYTSI